MTPSARSIKHLRSKGWQVGMTEKWNPYARIRQDLWGFADAVGCIAEYGQDGAYPTRRLEIALFQFTSTPNMGAREAKIRASKEAAYWLACGGKIYVMGWALRGARGKRKVYTLSEKEIVL